MVKHTWNTYESRRIHGVLNAQGHNVSLYMACDVIHELGIVGCIPQ